MSLAILRKRHRKTLHKANAAANRRDFPAAETAYKEYLRHVPDDPQALFNMGALRQRASKAVKDLTELHQVFLESAGYYADAIGSRWVDSETKADCLNNLGLIMTQRGFSQKAQQSFYYALQLNPNHRSARLNLADLLVFEGEYDAADREFFEIINSDPNSSGAQFSRSMLLLLTGEIARGFMEYRSRFKVPSFVSKILPTDKPIWDGQPLDGKTLVITQEQGWGDAIMFIRYAREIKDRWPESKIFFACATSLHGLMRGAIGLDGCLPDHLEPEFKTAAPEFDYHAPLMHLPDIMRTTLETIPARCPYILPQADWSPLNIKSKKTSNAERRTSNVERGIPLRSTFDVRSSTFDVFRIGLCWAGSPVHGKDKWRSIPVEQFQRFIDAGRSCQFYSLQCGPRAYETESLKNCVNLPKDIHDWTHTANAILQMDMVIAVDTAVAHLAGALGVPCWILIASSPDFRWMLGRPDSPWYPKARLFRQETRDDWEPVIQSVIAELGALK